MKHQRVWTTVVGIVILLIAAACQDDPDPALIPTLEVPEVQHTIEVPSLAPTSEPTEVIGVEPTATDVAVEPSDGDGLIQVVDNPVDDLPLCTPPSGWVSYTVVFGDTLAEIARRTDSTVAALSAANCIENPNRIRVGLLITVPRVPDPVPTRPATTPPPTHVTTVYDKSVCYQEPFMYDYGVEVGERWRLQWGQGSLPTYANPSDLESAGTLFESEPFTIVDGPHCFHNEGYRVPFMRRWYVESEVSNQRGWIDEYAEYATIMAAPEIVSFAVSSAHINEGDSVTISWEVRGLNSITLLEHHLLNYEIGDEIAGPLPPSGSITVTPRTGVSRVDFSIRGIYDVNEYRRVNITCAHAPIGLTTEQGGCPPAAAMTTEAAYQPFEGGFMIWRPGVIWVFFNQGYGNVFADGFAGQEQPTTEVPPAGFYIPERGFGKVWHEFPWIRADLGWATAPESGYDAELQLLNIYPTATGYFISLPNGVLIFINEFNTTLNWTYSSRPS